ncbi:MAG: AraC family transcriptional regulator [Oscillospiraceae bacterium]|nr:AraC family transcriptional regulator [Oscillospiraceae bacterium]
MNTSYDLSRSLFLHMENHFVRTSFSKEYERYADIRNGDMEQVRKNFSSIKKNYLEGKGILSENHLRNIRYHIIIATAMIARSCIEGGMPHDTAYTLSDIYILRADKCESEEALLELLGEMQLDFAERMQILKKDISYSFHVRRCVEYINHHLNHKLTVTELAEQTGLSDAYLSRLFKKETGCTITEYVHGAKIGAAQNLLQYSQLHFSEIALALGFSSQSAFITLFRKVTGFTPKQYRDRLGESI